MNTRHVVIVGGVAGGMSAATRLRRLEENTRITVVEKTGYVSFANCGLPYFVGGVIEQRSSLLLQTPQSLAARFGIDVLVDTEATAIDPESQTITLVGPDGERVEHYDDLVLSPGARPIIPSIPGIERALVLRNVEDVDRLASAVDAAKRAVVIGGGFIGMEMAENLVHKGITTAVVEATEQVMAPLDPEIAAIVHKQLRANGVDLYLGNAVTEVGAKHVVLGDGTQIAADVVIASIGVRPDVDLARAAGITIGERGGIVVDAQLQTNIPHIYAIGDAVEKTDGLSGEATLVPLANTANRQGRVLADILAGREGKDRPVLGTAIVGVFGLQIATTGWNEKRLQKAGCAYRAIHTHPFSHATYYPGAAGMSLKLLVDQETDDILGAQGIGADGVDKRIDVIATAMAGSIKAAQLADLELAYAPAFGSAKDPVNMLGYVDQNLAWGITESIQWHEISQAQKDGWTVVDVRTPAEFANGAIPGSVNIPVDELRERISELPEGNIIITCAVGIRGHIASRILTAEGRVSKNLDGGYKTWSMAQDQ